MRNKQQFLSLYQEHHEAFGRYCSAQAFGIIDADDLMSESLLNALESFDQLREEKAFLGFLISIAKNIIRNKIRRKKFSGVFKEEKALELPSQGIAADTRLDIQLLYQCLNRLPAAQKEAVILFEISGYSIKEIAEIQHAGESAVKQRLKRGREKLAQIMRLDQLREESVTQQSKILVSIFL